MPRKRNPENAGLPARWRLYHGAYYYQVPPGSEARWDGKRQFKLGTSLPEAYKEWARRLELNQQAASTIAQLLDRYSLEVVPEKKPTTQAHNAVAIKRLKAVLGDNALDMLRPQNVYQYIEARKESGTAARREVEVLSHAYTKAVEWGYLDRHPFKGEIRLKGLKSRTRYIEDTEVVEMLALEPKRKAGSVLVIQAYIRIKLLTGLRRGDMLRLTMSDLKEDGIHVTPEKTKDSSGKSLIYEWTPDLRAAVDAAKAARPRISNFLFCNRLGDGYLDEETGRAGGWDSMWRNFVDRVMEETAIKERFTEHDLRAKCASDAETLEHAQQLLAHADSRTTQRVYRRKAERVKPLNSKFE